MQSCLVSYCFVWFRLVLSCLALPLCLTLPSCLVLSCSTCCDVRGRRLACAIVRSARTFWLFRGGNFPIVLERFGELRRVGYRRRREKARRGPGHALENRRKPQPSTAARTVTAAANDEAQNYCKGVYPLFLIPILIYPNPYPYPCSL